MCKNLDAFRIALAVIIMLVLFEGAALAQFGPAKTIMGMGGTDIPQRLHAADLDNDGDIDILTSKMLGIGIQWAANDGLGNFSLPKDLPQALASTVVSLRTIDFDKDGDEDIVAAYLGAKAIQLWENTGSGNFASPIKIASNLEDINSLLIVDYDKDNDLDIAVALQYTTCVWLKNDRVNNTWSQEILGSSNADYLDIADLYQDGFLDILQLADNIPNGILLNGNSITTLYVKAAKFIKAIDLDNDGDLDVLAALNGYSDGIVWLEYNWGTFEPHIINHSADLDISALTVFDYDGDGDQDIFAGCWLDCGINLYENEGAGNFKYVPILGSNRGIEEQELISADLNGDGKKDLVKNDAAFHSIIWQENVAVPFTGLKAEFVHHGICVGSSVKFTHAARGKEITAWEWNFGDGSPSETTVNPYHTYATPGQFNVTLKVSNAGGQSNSITKTVVIKPLPTQNPHQDLKFCDRFMNVVLDSNYTYQWYYSPTNDFVFNTTNRFTFENVNLSFYVSKTDSFGCVSSDRDKISISYIGHPGSPDVLGAASYSGSKRLILKATPSGENEVVHWSKKIGDPSFHIGNTYVDTFTESTTYYVNAVNEVGCAGPSVPVSAIIHEKPIYQPQYVWANATSPEAYTQGLDIQMDKQGRLAVHASLGGTLVENGDTITNPKEFPFRATKLLIKYDLNGSSLGAKKIAWADSYYPNKILFDSKDNLFVYGRLTNDMIIGDLTIPLPSNADGWNQYFILLKFDKDNNLLWHKLFTCVSLHAALDGGDNLYLAGRYEHTVEIEGVTLVSGTEFGATFIARYNSSDELTFAKTTFHALEFNEGMTVDKNGNAYLAGAFDDEISFEGQTLKTIDKAFAMAKYNSSGELVWAKKMSNELIGFNVPQIKADHENNIILAGYFNAGDLSLNAEMVGIPIGGMDGYYVVKVSPDGEGIWAKNIPSKFQIEFNDMEIGHDNSIYIAGFYFGTSFPLEGLLLERSYFDVYGFAAKLNPNGVAQWIRDADMRPFAACVPDNNGDLFITGYFDKPVDLDEIHLDRLNSVVTTKLGLKFRADFKSDVPCLNGPIQFTDWSTADAGNTITNWLWEFGDGSTSEIQNPTHHYHQNGPFFVKLTIKDNLGNILTKESLIIVTASEQATLQAVGDSLVASPGMFYFWKKDGIPIPGHSKVYYPSETGLYQVKVLNHSGCSSISEPVAFMITGTELTPKSSVVVYPNPTTGKIKIATESRIQKVELRDAFGRTVHAKDYSTEEIDASNLSPGVYFLLLYTPDSIIRRQIIKQ